MQDIIFKLFFDGLVIEYFFLHLPAGTGEGVGTLP